MGCIMTDTELEVLQFPFCHQQQAQLRHLQTIYIHLNRQIWTNSVFRMGHAPPLNYLTPADILSPTKFSQPYIDKLVSVFPISPLINEVSLLSRFDCSLSINKHTQIDVNDVGEVYPCEILAAFTVDEIFIWVMKGVLSQRMERLLHFAVDKVRI